MYQGFFENNRSKEQAYLIAAYTLKYFKIRFTTTALLEKLTEHPYYPDIIALPDICYDYGIKARLVEGEMEELKQVQLPVIVALKEENNSHTYVLLKEFSNEKVVYDCPGKGIAYLTEEVFQSQWMGFAMLLEKVEKIRERGQKKEQNRQPLFLLLILTTIVIMAFAGRNLTITNTLLYPLLPLLILKMVGIWVSINLLNLEQKGVHSNKLLDKVCTHGVKFDCLKVLQSSGSAIFGVGMTDLGVIYFLGGALMIIIMVFFSGITVQGLAILSLMSVLALPFTIYSVLYQGFKIKNWCMICLSIQVLLWLEVLVLWKSIINITFLSLTPEGISIGLTVYMSAGIYLFYRKVFIEFRVKNEDYRSSYHKIYGNFNVCISLLKSSPFIPDEVLPGDLIIGKGDTPLQLTVVLGSFCKHCEEALESISELTDRFYDYITIKIRVVSSIDAPIGLDFAGQVLMNNQSLAHDSLRKWYWLINTSPDSEKDEKENYSKWKKIQFGDEYRVTQGAMEAYQKLNTWWFNTKQLSTPGFILNGYQWPELYRKKDLRYFIEDFSEYFST